MNSNALSDRQITDILKTQGIKINGIYAKNDLPQLTKGWYIVNMMNSDKHRCGHWVALFYAGNDKEKSAYYDAFGFEPPLEVLKRAPNLLYQNVQIQDIDSTACGFFCIACILYDYNPQYHDVIKHYKRFLAHFVKNTLLNDNILEKMLEKNGIHMFVKMI